MQVKDIHKYFQNQWIHNRGRCGVCGDPVQDIPRPNEAGGRYASGVITRNYKTGDDIDLTADLSANHLGYFEYRVCPVEDPNVPVTQDCLDKHPVYITETRDGRYHVKASENGVIFMKGRLPANMSCDHCVLQWRYNTGSQAHQTKNYLMYESKFSILTYPFLLKHA